MSTYHGITTETKNKKGPRPVQASGKEQRKEWQGINNLVGKWKGGALLGHGKGGKFRRREKDGKQDV